MSLVPTVLQRDRDFESLPTLELGWAFGWLDGVNNGVHIMIVVRGHSDESTSLGKWRIGWTEFGIGRFIILRGPRVVEIFEVKIR